MISTYTYILSLSVCLFVCMFVCTPKNVETAEPIGPNFFVGPCETPGKVYGWSNFRFSKIFLHQNLNVENFENPRNFCFVITENPNVFYYHSHVIYWQREPPCNLLMRRMLTKRPEFLLYIYFACLFVSLFVCLYPINVKTAEPIGPIFCVEPHITPGKVYEWSKFQN